MSRALLWPALAYIGWVFFLYAWLTYARAAAVKRGAVDYSSFAFNREEPREVARIRLNLANQFELPLFFFFAVSALIALGAVTAFDVAAAWLFLAGRVAHSLVQTLTDNVVLRGRVFVINFLAVCAILAHLGWIALGR